MTSDNKGNAGGSKGIVEHLNIIANMIVSISEKETDPDKKSQYFEEIFERLQQDGEEIVTMKEEMDQELPEKVADKAAESDVKVSNAADRFLDSIDLMMEFMETEQSETAEQARNAIKEGSDILDEAEDVTLQAQDELGEVDLLKDFK